MTEPLESRDYQEIVPGYEQPIVPEDEYVAGLYQHYELGDTPTMRELEPVATRLLGELGTSHTAIEMVLGRQLDVDTMPERYPLLSMLVMTGDAPKDKFGALLMVRSAEDEKRQA